MQHLLSENPWPIVSAFGLVALFFLIASWTTGNRKYLVFGLSTVAIAILLILIEQVWVTDRERIEWVIYDIARAAQSSNANGVLEHLAPEASLGASDNLPRRRFGVFGHSVTEAGIRDLLSRTQFDYVRVYHVTVNVGTLSRQGRAEFQSQAVGTYSTTVGEVRFGATRMGWSLGFRETSPKVWKVTRITPINPPSDLQRPFGSGRF
jgi:hypothetical protein